MIYPMVLDTIEEADRSPVVEARFRRLADIVTRQ